MSVMEACVPVVTACARASTDATYTAADVASAWDAVFDAVDEGHKDAYLALWCVGARAWPPWQVDAWVAMHARVYGVLLERTHNTRNSTGDVKKDVRAKRMVLSWRWLLVRWIDVMAVDLERDRPLPFGGGSLAAPGNDRLVRTGVFAAWAAAVFRFGLQTDPIDIWWGLQNCLYAFSHVMWCASDAHVQYAEAQVARAVVAACACRAAPLVVSDVVAAMRVEAPCRGGCPSLRRIVLAVVAAEPALTGVNWRNIWNVYARASLSRKLPTLLQEVAAAARRGAWARRRDVLAVWVRARTSGTCVRAGTHMPMADWDEARCPSS